MVSSEAKALSEKNQGMAFAQENGTSNNMENDGVGVLLNNEAVEQSISIFGLSDGVLCNDAENVGNADTKGNCRFDSLAVDEVGVLDKGLEDKTGSSVDDDSGPSNMSILSKDFENGGASKTNRFSAGIENVTGENSRSEIVNEGRAQNKVLESETWVCIGERFWPTKGAILLDNKFEKNNGVDSDNVGDHEVKYSVGDFVWAKWNCHPWWPAQIYDPSDASDHAKKCRLADKPFLVAYFADGTYSWRSSSQLRPFAENFDELSLGNYQSIFSEALQSVLDEIGRVAELKMTCHCIPEENRADFRQKNTTNIGIKEGVIRPKYDFSRLPVPEFEPSNLLSRLSSIARGDLGGSIFELTGLSSYLSAYYGAKGGRKLTPYQEGGKIEGMKNRSKNRCRVGKGGSSMQRYAGLVKDARKRKHAHFEVSNISAVISRDEGQEKAVDKDADDVFEEETKDMTASRKKKKSRYLCYPYVSLDSCSKIINSGRKRDIGTGLVEISDIDVVGNRGPQGKKSSSSVLGLQDLSQTLSEIPVSEFAGQKEKNKKTKNLTDDAKDNEELLFIKQSLEEITAMVTNCDGDKFPEVKLSLEAKMKVLLEKISAMLSRPRT